MIKKIKVELHVVVYHGIERKSETEHALIKDVSRNEDVQQAAAHLARLIQEGINKDPDYDNFK